MNKLYALLPLVILFQIDFINAQNIGINVQNPEALFHVQADHREVVNEGFESDSHAPLVAEGTWIKLGGSYAGDFAYSTDYLPQGQSKHLILDIVVPADSFAVLSYAYSYYLFEAMVAMPFLDTLTESIQSDWVTVQGKVATGQHQLRWSFLASNEPAAVNGSLILDEIRVLYYPIKSPAFRFQDGREAEGMVLSSDQEGNICWDLPVVNTMYDEDADTGIQLEENDDDIIRFITVGKERFVVNENRLETGAESPSLFIGKGAGKNAMLTMDNGQGNIGIGDSVLTNYQFDDQAPLDGQHNIGIGYFSLHENTTGKQNTSIGSFALSSNTIGIDNNGFGYEALQNNTEGINNVAVGTSSLAANTTGSSNIAIGKEALSSNQNGDKNVSIGHYALFNAKELGRNIAIGDSSLLKLNELGSDDNIAIGEHAMSDLLGGSKNITIGNQSFNKAVYAYGNISMGHQSQFDLINGNNNISLGNYSLFSNQLNDRVIAIGDSAVFKLVGSSSAVAMGDETMAIGHGSLKNLAAGDGNLAIGNGSLVNLINGEFNLAIGGNALSNLYQGDNNLAIGNDALKVVYTGSENTAIGRNSLWLNNGERNIALGYRALDTLIAGNDNIGIGANVMPRCTNGTEMVIIGNEANAVFEDGRGVTAVGFGANQFMTRGDFNTAIGHFSMYTDTIIENVTALGHGAYFGGSDNLVRLGNFQVTHIGGYAAWSNLSDRRFKKNIKEDVKGLSFINALRPVSYNMDSDAYVQWQEDVTGVTMPWNLESLAKKDARVQYGFLAQEVEQAANNLGFDFSGVNAPQSEKDHYTVSYATFTVPLVKAVQELSEENEKLKAELDNTNRELEALKLQMQKITLLIENSLE